MGLHQTHFFEEQLDYEAITFHYENTTKNVKIKQPHRVIFYSLVHLKVKNSLCVNPGLQKESSATLAAISHLILNFLLINKAAFTPSVKYCTEVQHQMCVSELRLDQRIWQDTLEMRGVLEDGILWRNYKTIKK